MPVLSECRTTDRAAPADLPVGPRAARLVGPLLLVVGAQVWLTAGRGDYGQTYRLKILLAIAALLAVPVVRRAAIRSIDWVDAAARRCRPAVAWGVAGVAAAYLGAHAVFGNRVTLPVFADDFSYLLQTRMIAAGRLWGPRHELADFFESIHLIVEPAYASIYFPGAAMLFAPGVWLGLPSWVIPLIASAAIVGLTYRVTAELLGDADGLMAALFVLSLTWFRTCSVIVASRIPLMLFGMLATWAWLRWRRPDAGRGWTLAIGALCGWAAITRPVDALVVAIPIGLAMALDLRRPATPGTTVRPPLARTAALLVLGASPFLATQAVLNVGVTGSPFRTPFNAYADRDYPHTAYGLHRFDPAVRPASTLAAKQDSYDAWVVPFVTGLQPDAVLGTFLNTRIGTTVECVFPHAFLVALVPAGALAMGGRRWVVAAVFPLFLLAYSVYAFFLQPYTLMAAPAAALLVMCGRRAIAAALPARGWTGAYLAAAIVALCATAFPETNRLTRDQPWPYAFEAVDRALATVERPAVVLFRYGGEWARWPVYNAEVVNPDDAPVVRANDLGDRNGELYRYYATRQPSRIVYRYDLRTDALERLGRAADLAPR